MRKGTITSVAVLLLLLLVVWISWCRVTTNSAAIEDKCLFRLAGDPQYHRGIVGRTEYTCVFSNGAGFAMLCDFGIEDTRAKGIVSHSTQESVLVNKGESLTNIVVVDEVVPEWVPIVACRRASAGKTLALGQFLIRNVILGENSIWLIYPKHKAKMFSD